MERERQSVMKVVRQTSASLRQKVIEGACRAREKTFAGMCKVKKKLLSAKGQGTTEYAILVGVLVVIAILAITVFRPKIQELWDAIAEGINGL